MQGSSLLTKLLRNGKANIVDLQKRIELAYQDKSDKITQSQKIFFGVILIMAVYFYGVYSTKIEMLSNSTTRSSPIPTLIPTIRPSATPSTSLSPSPSIKPSLKPSNIPKVPSTPKPTPIPIQTPQVSQPVVPSEYKSALNKATSYSNTMNMSKRGVYDQLVSEYGEKFSTVAAQYAIDNVKADWNANALAKARSYRDTMHMSPAGIHDQLTSDYGEKFTQSEADYAIQHLN